VKTSAIFWWFLLYEARLVLRDFSVHGPILCTLTPKGLALYSSNLSNNYSTSASSYFLSRQHFIRALVVLIHVTVIAGCATLAQGCPFCSALAPTLSDDLKDSSVAVMARHESVSVDKDGLRVCRLRVLEVFKGNANLLNSVIELPEVDVLSHDGVFWLVGYGKGSIMWGKPKATSSGAVTYLRGLTAQPRDQQRPLAYFLPYLQHPDELIAADAYNEFADANFKDICQLKEKLDRNWIIDVVRDPSVPVHRRRLCWTLLSQCGTPDDTLLFDELLRLRQADQKFNPAMDSAIACFISLGGESALSRIERDYLEKPDASYLDVFAAVSAIRVHGTDLNVLPRQRLAIALGKILSRAELADLVIADLARWEDWSAIDRVVTLFETATEETHFIKPVVVLYLKACPLAEADTALNRLRALDPQTIRAAEASLLFYPGVATVPVPLPADEEPSQTLAVPKSPRVTEKQSTKNAGDAAKKHLR
jgi:hypothetical protein